MELLDVSRELSGLRYGENRRGRREPQMLGYLNITGLPLGLLLNFRYRKLQIKRVILGGLPELEPLVL